MFPQIFVRNLVTQETPTNPLRTCLKVFVPVQIKLKFGSVGFLGRGNRSTLRKSSWRKSGNQQQIHLLRRHWERNPGGITKTGGRGLSFLEIMLF